MLKTQLIEYRDGETVLEGFCAYDDATQEKRPAVLVAHDWSGRNKFADEHAKMLAEMGYVGFAVDMYGKGKLGKNKEENIALMQPLMSDRAQLQKRIGAALETVVKMPTVDSKRIAAIGFCFGGLCVLDLARSGADVKGVVSFHGNLTPPEGLPEKHIIAKLLVLHGYDDPMVTPDQILLFGKLMTQLKADWQFNIYSNTMHAFTNPQANDPAFGTVYNKQTAARSWIAMKDFFNEIF